MNINYAPIKHTAGIVALTLMVPASQWPHGKWIALGLAVGAFLCGALSDNLLTKAVADTFTATTTTTVTAPKDGGA